MDPTDPGDTPDTADDAIEQPDTVTELGRMPVDVYAMFFALVKLATNPRSAKRAVRELRDAANAAASERAQLAADRAEHAAHIAKTTAELEQRKKTAASIWETVRSRESAVEGREARCLARETEFGLRGSNQPRNHPDFVPIAGTTITREPERRTVRSGPGDTVDWPQNVTLEREPDESEPAPPVAAIRGRKTAPLPGAA